MITARTFKRHGRDEDRWCWEKFEAFKGVPWEPVPGRRGIEVHPRVTLPREEEEVKEPQEGKEKKTTMSENWKGRGQKIWIECRVQGM